jgi:predicted nuclease of predicted toxin-antitoxin system
VKFKLDESLPAELVTNLHESGHEADTVVDEKLHGAPDPVVVQAVTRLAGYSSNLAIQI